MSGIKLGNGRRRRFTRVHEDKAHDRIDEEQEAGRASRRDPNIGPETDTPQRSMLPFPFRRDFDRRQVAHVVERALEPRHDLMKAALSVGHDSEAAFEAGGEAGMTQLDEIAVVVRIAQHVVDELPKAIAADILVEEAHDEAAPRPFGGMHSTARKVLCDIVDRRAKRIFRSLAASRSDSCCAIVRSKAAIASVARRWNCGMLIRTRPERMPAASASNGLASASMRLRTCGGVAGSGTSSSPSRDGAIAGPCGGLSPSSRSRGAPPAELASAPSASARAPASGLGPPNSSGELLGRPLGILGLA